MSQGGNGFVMLQPGMAHWFPLTPSRLSVCIGFLITVRGWVLALFGQLLQRFGDIKVVPFRRARSKKAGGPSVSMYFADPLSDLIDDDESFSGRPIQQLSPSLYVSGAKAVVIRYVNWPELKILREGKFEKIYLLIDDDLEGLDDAQELPADYRERMIKYRDGPFRQLCDMVTDVVAPSEHILRSYRRQRTLQLEPAQCHKLPELNHHSDTGRLEIVFAGTRSHLQDFEHVAVAMKDVLQRHPEARLTTFLKGHVPDFLKKLPNAVHLAPMGWQQYRSFVGLNKYHIAVAPALPTSFNRARSISKLHDHAALGAAGLYTRQAPFDRIVSHGQTGVLLGNDPGEWRETLFELAAKREKVRKIARGGQILSRTLGSRRRVRSFWQRELNF